MWLYVLIPNVTAGWLLDYFEGSTAPGLYVDSSFTTTPVQLPYPNLPKP